MRRIWTVHIAMRDLDDPDEREIEFWEVLADLDASYLAIDTTVMKSAQKGVDQVLRAHRLITVGEE